VPLRDSQHPIRRGRAGALARIPSPAAGRAIRLAVALVLGLATPGRSAAQQPLDLPAYAPINPLAASRSGLGFEPYHPAGGRRWHVGLGLDYANMIESESRPGAGVLVDAEVMRLDASVRRDLDPRTFVLADVAVGGAYAGFLDGFLDWYHGLLGIRLPERDARPRNSFAYVVLLPDGRMVQRESSSLFLGDMRVGLGRRFGSKVRAQSVLAVSLPTSTAPVGYGRGTVSASLLNTVQYPLSRALAFEGSVSGGLTPRHGDLSDYQRIAFVAASTGLRFRFWGRQSLYANLFYHSPYYHDTTLPAMDHRELSLDFGWILATRNGREWRIGMTEDMEPSGPAVDIVFRFGTAR
jgi:hypothetical protein